METWDEVKAWRKAQRAELIAARVAFPSNSRKIWNERIMALLDTGFPVPPSTIVGFCWPYKGEPDPRFTIRRWRDRGIIAALPAVIQKAGPLQFRTWWPGAPMMPGAYGILAPDDTEIVVPDAVLVPMNGFDDRGYRLGYGGGYFDRTLAALERRVLAIGLSHEALRLQTIHPQPHDIPMDFVVTDAGIYRAGGEKLALLSAIDCAAEVKSLLERRRLPRHAHSSSIQPTEASWLRSYSSPPCYAQDVAPDYFGQPPTMPAEDLTELLNVLLEAERAGAKVLAAFLGDYERESLAWKKLAAVQRDEATNCAILIDLIRRVNGIPSAATGDFLGKALAVPGKIERLRFLNRGQHWVARKIRESLPHVEQDFVRGALSAMQESHLLNIEACDALVKFLEAQNTH